MPSKSLSDQRARAIFALGFLEALRADTLVSLRVEHFDIERRRIVQNGRVSRAKAGKTFDIVWNPIPRVFEQTVIDWVQTLRRLGFRGSDALFPHAKYLRHMPRTRLVDCKPVPVMSTYHVVTQAFKLACQTTESKYTPHCVKDTIAAERDALPLTRLQRAAMSANMGHANERITEQHYGNMPDEQRIEVMESIGEASIDTLPELSDLDKVALVDEIIAAVYRR